MHLSRLAWMRWRGSRTRRATLAVAIAAGVASSCGRFHGGSNAGQEWIGAWEAAPQLTEPANMPPAPGLSGNTLRQRIHPSLGGTRWRFRLSNEFGDGPMVIEAAHVARATSRDAIDASTDFALRFGGHESLTLARGEAATSDPISFSSDAFSDIAITLYLSRTPSGLTGHPGSRTSSFIVPGNQVSAATLAGAGDDVALVRDQRRGSAFERRRRRGGAREFDRRRARLDERHERPMARRLRASVGGRRDEKRAPERRRAQCGNRRQRGRSGRARSDGAGSIRPGRAVSGASALGDRVRWSERHRRLAPGFGGSRRSASDRRVRRHDPARARAGNQSVRRHRDAVRRIAVFVSRTRGGARDGERVDPDERRVRRRHRFRRRDEGPRRPEQAARGHRWRGSSSPERSGLPANGRRDRPVAFRHSARLDGRWFEGNSL